MGNIDGGIAPLGSQAREMVKQIRDSRPDETITSRRAGDGMIVVYVEKPDSSSKPPPLPAA